MQSKLDVPLRDAAVNVCATGGMSRPTLKLILTKIKPTKETSLESLRDEEKI